MASPKTRKKPRISKLAQCIRRFSSTARIKKSGMVDNAAFEPKTLSPNMSGKFHALINKIRELDIADMTTTGSKFKHFIFTDIRESAFGAKALAGYMVAGGFDLRMGNLPKLIKRGGKLVKTKHGETQLIHKAAVPGGCDGFALLQSLPLWKTPLMVNVKKDILNTYNARPDNVNGELLRIIILDSKFKEGIDLKDVKYVHLLEPPIAESDLKQAVGRATRFCGQSGLHFIPRRGWPLHVYTYRTELPGRPPFVKEGEAVQKVDAHELLLTHSGLDLALINLTKELTGLAIQTAVDYDLNYKINNFEIPGTRPPLEDEEVLVAEVAPESQDGGGRKKRVSGLYTTHDLTPKFLSKCFKRSSKLYPFTKGQLRATALSLGYTIPNIYPRELYCKLLQRDPEYLEIMQTKPVNPVVRPRVPRPVASESPASSEDESPDRYAEPVKPRRQPVRRPSSNIIPAASSAASSLASSRESSAASSLASSRGSSAAKGVKAEEVEKQVYHAEKFRKALGELRRLPFPEFQKRIADLYEEFKWESPVVKNGCGVIAAGEPGTAVTFTRTQDFVRHYLTPSSPFKGLLAWHSVGTGKTCMAVAAATSEFEAADYTILWVTRNALMSDVYKNIFGAVCSIPIMEKLETGYTIPADLTSAKRMLSRAWIQPITYRMFQNALQGKNELGRMLLAKNSKDPLYRTFLVMDEVHKLMDGDLSAAESADFSVIQSFIQKSYSVSKANSVRPLLMTATPITDTPRELFAILNTLIGEPTGRLMEFEAYRKKYTTPKGEITEEGRAYFQERTKGLISYLNREYDPTTFAQPVFKDVVVPVGGVVGSNLEDLVARCTADLELPAPPSSEESCDDLKETMKSELLSAKGLAAKEKIRKTYKKRRSACLKRLAATRKAHKAALKAVLKEADACYLAQKKLFTKVKGPNQLSELEECFGKKQRREVFPSKADFKAAVQDRLSAAHEDISSVAESNTGAVFANENT